MTVQQTIDAIVKVLDDKKGKDIVVLDVSKLTVICDWMIIATGRNSNLVKSMADDVEDKMAEFGISPRHVEGVNDARWVILDFNNILVHIFHPEEREYYKLERLWDDGTNRQALNLEYPSED